MTVKKALSFLCWMLIPLSLCGNERFLQWDDIITINKDGSVEVEERIVVQTEGILFKHGLWRTFPTRYSGILGLQYVVDFDLKRVEHNGANEDYVLVDRINGKHIYIGDPAKLLRPGIHTFLISYKAEPILGFFKDHDELYFNVIGADVNFVVERATATVNLPRGVPRQNITFEAYTGYEGQKGSNYRAVLLDSGALFFETKKALRPRQAFTIVVSWPKGYIAEPLWIRTLYRFVWDNISFLLLLIGLLALILFYIYSYRSTQIRYKKRAIIPHFYPPAHTSPGSLRYLMRKGYDVIGLTADIVDMAIKGFLTIEYKKNSLFGGTYALKVKDLPGDGDENKYYLNIYSILSKRGKDESIALVQKNSTLVRSITASARREYKKNMDQYIIYHRSYSAIGFMLSLLFLIPSIALAQAYIMSTFIIWVALYVIASLVLHIYFYLAFPVYTIVGRMLLDEIEGFKLFLKTTEVDRLKVIGTPPIKTPQLWEKYLPFALALGVEQQWTKQFAPVLARLEKDDISYRPHWYRGAGPFNIRHINIMTTGLRQSFSTAIASAKAPPGTTSGAHGRGGAGGGSGGGGAGGW